MENRPSLVPPTAPPISSQPSSPEALLVAPEKKSKKCLIIILVLLSLTTSGATGYFLYQNHQLKRPLSQTQPLQAQSPPGSSQTPPSPSEIEPSSRSLPSSIILKIPIIEYKVPGNKLSEVIITGYQDKVIKAGEEFIIDAATLGFNYKSSVGNIKLKLVEVQENSILVDILADEIFDGSFHLREPVEKKEITEGTCLNAYPLVMDVFYKYCFTVSKDNQQLSFIYTITGESTMPPPP